jgi:hypothetical protein
MSKENVRSWVNFVSVDRVDSWTILVTHTWITVGQGEAVGESDNAEVSLISLINNSDLIIFCRIEEYATMLFCIPREC